MNTIYRYWLSVSSLKELKEEETKPIPENIIFCDQRAPFIESGSEAFFIYIELALHLQEKITCCVLLGLKVYIS